MRRQSVGILFCCLLAAFIVPSAPFAQTPAVEAKEGLAQADALAKAGQTERALAILERFLEENPKHTDGQLLYARTLGWRGEYERAIEVYREVTQREPENADAHAGLARVLSWKGDYSLSIEAYRRSLFLEPRATEVRMGLARTLWWKGDNEASLEELSKVLSREPGNAEALGLERRLRLDKGPYFRAVYANSSDSDRNRLQVYQAVFNNTFGLKGHRFEFSYKLFDASLPDRSAKAGIFDIKDSIKLWNRAALTPRLGLVSIDSNVSDTAYLTVGLGFSMPVAKDTVVSAAYNRYPLLDTARLMENNIRVDEAYIGLTHDIKRATLSASAAHADYSDGNSRYDLSGGVAINIMDAPRIVAGATSEYRDFSERKANGYFNPPHIFSNSVYLDAFGQVWQKLSLRAKATLGIQSFEEKSDYTTSFQAGFEWAATRDLMFDAGYKYSRSALESASGFRFEEFRAGVNYLF